MLAPYLVNGILMGGPYACLAVAFSLIWRVLNIVKLLHGLAVVLTAYISIFGVHKYGLRSIWRRPSPASAFMARDI